MTWTVKINNTAGTLKNILLQLLCNILKNVKFSSEFMFTLKKVFLKQSPFCNKN